MVSVCCPTVTLGALEGDIVGGGASKWTMMVRFRRAFWAEGGKRGVTEREPTISSQILKISRSDFHSSNFFPVYWRIPKGSS